MTSKRCRFCETKLPEGANRFSVTADSEGGPIGHWCTVKCYLSTVHGPERVEEAYAKVFVPRPIKLASHADADTLQPEEGIL